MTLNPPDFESINGQYPKAYKPIVIDQEKIQELFDRTEVLAEGMKIISDHVYKLIDIVELESNNTLKMAEQIQKLSECIELVTAEEKK